MFSFKESNMLFFSFVCCFSRILYSLLVPGKQERAELHAVLGTETMRRGTCLDSLQGPRSATPFSDPLQWLPSVTSFSDPLQWLPSVTSFSDPIQGPPSGTPFSDPLQWPPSATPFRDPLQWLPSVTLLKCNLFSYVPLTQDMECFLALWRLLFAWLCFCSVFFLLLKSALYEYILMCVSTNKAPLFHSRLGSPASFLSSTPVPRSQSSKTMTNNFGEQPIIVTYKSCLIYAK